MHPQSPPLTIGGTVLKESDDLVILGVIDSKMIFEMHVRSVSREASQRLGIVKKYWRVFHDRSLLWSCFGVSSCQFWSILFYSVVLGCLNYWTVNQWCPISNWGCV